MGKRKSILLILFLLVVTTILLGGCAEKKPSTINIGDTGEGNNWELKVVSVERENKLYSGEIPTPLNPFAEEAIYTPPEEYIFVTLTIQLKNTGSENNSVNSEMFLVTDDKYRNFLPEGTTSELTGFINAQLKITMPPGDYTHERTLVYVMPTDARCLKLKLQDLPPIYLGGGCNENAIRYGDTVELNYTGRLEDGTVFDTSYEDVAKEAGLAPREEYAPLKFIVGARQVIPGLDEAAIGMKRGEEKVVTISPEKAYGYPIESPRTEVITLEIFKEIAEQEPALGMIVQPQNFPYPIKVIKISDTGVTIEYEPTPNTEYSPSLKVFEVDETHISWGHPLAGRTLTFEIKVENFY